MRDSSQDAEVGKSQREPSRRARVAFEPLNDRGVGADGLLFEPHVRSESESDWYVDPRRRTFTYHANALARVGSHSAQGPT